jgi:hypothetical protein
LSDGGHHLSSDHLVPFRTVGWDFWHIDGLNALRPGAHLGYPALFLLASVSTLLGTLLMLRIREK